MSLEVDLQTFAAAHADGAFTIDVREPYEYVEGHVPGAVLMPLDSVPRRVRELPTDRTVYVICASGNRSYTAARWLARAGVTAVSVAGGTGGWIGMGKPVVRGHRENAA